MSTKRDSIREKALASRPGKTKLVTFDGVDYEIRAPSVRARDEIFAKSGLFEAAADKTGKTKQDSASLQVWAVIACTYIPRDPAEVTAGAEPERVFDDGDFAFLESRPSGDITDALSPSCIELVNVSHDPVAAKKD